MMVHTGTSALWTTTRSLPDSAVCVRQLGNSRQRRCCFLFTIRSASATGISTGSGVHKPALTREESSRGPRPLDSQFSNTLPEGSVFWRESADGAKQEINRTTAQCLEKWRAEQLLLTDHQHPADTRIVLHLHLHTQAVSNT
jgi:hypothetical protein